MTEPSVEQIRCFRLGTHHLDTAYPKADIPQLVGACGMQNTPPGAWETALYNRVPDCSLSEMGHLLYQDKILLQAWSLRGAPVVFPTLESDTFLSALMAHEEEPWIYTPGISGALDFLQMTFTEVFDILKQVMPRLDENTIVSKSALDQTIAAWMCPLLPATKRDLWESPSMYGSPDKQTVGGAAVSFLLRPCAFSGLVVFGERKRISPAFTSYKAWTGRRLLQADKTAPQKLARKYLHCYGPATVDMFITWLGCSRKQGQRIWKTIAEETEPVTVLGKKAFILSADRDRLFSPVSWSKELFLLGGHDPFLDQRDRIILQPDPALHKEIWKFTLNPGAVIYRGEAIGIWTSQKKGSGIQVKVSLWSHYHLKQSICTLAESYSAFRRQKLECIEI